jgi:REP element-mobilizing transposase RayT
VSRVRARRPRVQYPGAIYHVINRGDRREAIFWDDQDRGRFVETLGEVCQKAQGQGHAYGLMGNHFHLAVETPLGNWVDGMKWFWGTYTSRFNRRRRFSGRLFSGRYKALVVEGDDHELELDRHRFGNGRRGLRRCLRARVTQANVNAFTEISGSPGPTAFHFRRDQSTWQAVWRAAWEGGRCSAARMSTASMMCTP